MDFYWDNVFFAILRLLRLLKVASMVVALEPFLTAQSKAWLITAAAVLFSVSFLALSLVGVVPNDGFFAVGILPLAYAFAMVTFGFLFLPFDSFIFLLASEKIRILVIPSQRQFIEER